MLELFFAGAVTAMIGFWLGFFTVAFFLGSSGKEETHEKLPEAEE